MSSNLTAADFKNCSGNWGNLATGRISCVWVYQVERGVYRARNILQAVFFRCGVLSLLLPSPYMPLEWERGK